MEQDNEFSQLFEQIKKIKSVLSSLTKYKGNQNYKKKLSELTLKLNKQFRFLKAKLNKTNEPALNEKFKKVEQTINLLLGNSKIGDKLNAIKELELFWPEIEVEFENLRLNIRSFDIPSEIPMTEYRLDLEEAIKDFDNGCFISSLVLCRRAYEGALVEAYKIKEKKEPIEEIKCKNCKVTIREKAYFGISKLHEWAIKNDLVTDRLKQVGFLLSDMGSGAAHPPLTDFKRDKEIARLGITATITLLKELNTKGDKK